MAPAAPTVGFDDLDVAWLPDSPAIRWRHAGPDELPAWVSDMDYPRGRVVVDALDCSC